MRGEEKEGRRLSAAALLAGAALSVTSRERPS
jgi:hypothetical protein